MTETPILDESAVSEIEAQLKALSERDEPWESTTDKTDTFRNVAARYALALCATVRYLRERVQLLDSRWCECGHTKDKHGFFSDHDECYECDQASPDLCCVWRPIARPDTQLEHLQSQLEQLRAGHRESEKQLREWQDKVVSLMDRLAQVEQERDELREQLAAEVAKRINANVEQMKQSQKVSSAELEKL